MRFQKDRAGFPMIYIEPIGAHLHYLPVTKIQLERFVCSFDQSAFDGAWYDELLSLNQRTSAASLKISDAKSLFGVWAGGLLPAEAAQYCDWSGKGMRLPTLAEWHETYLFLRQMRPQPIDWQQALPGLDSRTTQLLERLAGGTYATLADQMFLRNGVFEWVELHNRGERWGGMGFVPLEIHGHTHSPDSGNPHGARLPETHRRSYYGFRALQRDIAA